MALKVEFAPSLSLRATTSVTLEACTCTWFSTDTANNLCFAACLHLLATVPPFFTLLSSSFVSVTALRRVCDSKIILHAHYCHCTIAGEPKWLPALEFLSFTRISVVDTHGKHAREQLCGWMWEKMHTMAWGYRWGVIGIITSEERWILTDTELSGVLLPYNLFAAHMIQFGAMIVPK